MVITNLTTGRVLADRAAIARRMRDRIVGLISRAHLSDGEALVIPRCASIHTFFMRFDIDALFLKQGVVIKAIERLRPWRLAAAWGAETVIEMPAGTIAGVCIRRGDRLQIEHEAKSVGATETS